MGLALDSYKILASFFEKLALVKGLNLVGAIKSPLEYIGRGAFRETFSLNSDWVIKNPLSKESCIQNLQEYFISRALPTYFAFCFLYKLNGIPILIAERVTPVSDHLDVLSRDLLDDGFYQTGMTKSGRFVCYDAGNEIDLVNENAATMLTALKDAPELTSYDELVARIEADWKEYSKNLPVIPYKKMIPLKKHVKKIAYIK